MNTVSKGFLKIRRIKDSYETCFDDIIIPFDNSDGLNIIGKVIMYNTVL